MAVSEYSFGEYESGEELGEQPMQQGPKWFRDYMDKVSGQLTDLKAENDRLKATQQRAELEATLKARGYAPQAAGLYAGDPTGLDDWLSANGAALAKLDAPEGQEQRQEQPAGPPASTVPADGQEQMQRMLEQGTQGVAPPQGSDKEIAAALDAARTPEEFAQLMQAHGSPYQWGPNS